MQSIGFSSERAYSQYMQSLFRYVRSSPLRHPHRVPAPILTVFSTALRRACGASCIRLPVLCVNDEVAKSGGTGITIAYTEDMLSRERTMDCIMHYSLGDNTIYQELGTIWRRDNSSPSGRTCSIEGRPIQERRRIPIARPKGVAMR